MMLLLLLWLRFNSHATLFCVTGRFHGYQMKHCTIVIFLPPARAYRQPFSALYQCWLTAFFL